MSMLLESLMTGSTITSARIRYCQGFPAVPANICRWTFSCCARRKCTPRASTCAYVAATPKSTAEISSRRVNEGRLPELEIMEADLGAQADAWKMRRKPRGLYQTSCDRRYESP